MKEASTFDERYQELEEKIKPEAAAAKSNLKQNEDKRTAGTTEADGYFRETAPHDQESDANTAAAQEKTVTVRCNAYSQRSNNGETMSNYNSQNKTPKIRR